MAEVTMPQRKAAKKKMPAFTKPTEKTVKAFENATGELAHVERRTMFGYPSVFLNGNMLACIFQDRIMVRLSPADREDAASNAGAKPFEPSPGRAMKEYVDLPAKIVGSPSDLRGWLERGRQYVATLPPKTSGAKTSGARTARPTSGKPGAK
jgi:TfoX/Sxy family transcriptional regulator of competence genes